MTNRKIVRNFDSNKEEAFMNQENNRGWYLVSPEAISRYLYSVIKDWGYFVIWNTSDDSESCYLNANLGTMEEPKALHVRISNHTVPVKNQWIRFNVDLYCDHDREGATSYIKFLTKLSNELNRPMPASLDRVKAGTPLYKQYRIKMQHRAKYGSRSCSGDRLYV